MWYYNTTVRSEPCPTRRYFGTWTTTRMATWRTSPNTGVTKEEVEEVLANATDADISRSTGRPVVFGDTLTGRHLIVVFEVVDDDTVYPVTAYDVPRSQRP